jgi:hypothetical protein
MRGIRNEIKHIMKTVTVLAALFAMTFVWAGSASAIVIGNPLQSAILNPPVASEAFVRPPLVNPFFRPNPFVNPFFRPNPFAANPFLGADLDDVGLGLGFGFGVGIGD